MKKIFCLLLTLIYVFSIQSSYAAESDTNYAQIAETDEDILYTNALVSDEAIRKELAGSIVFLAGNTNVLVDGKLEDVLNGEIEILASEDGILVPADFIAEKYNLTQSRNNKSVTLSLKNSTDAVFNVGSDKARINGKEIMLTAVPVISDGVVMLPMRDIAQQFLKKNVIWSDTRKLLIVADGKLPFEEDNEEYIRNTAWLISYNLPTGKQVVERVKTNNPGKKHPRILCNEDTFERLRTLVKEDENAAKWYEVVKKAADKMLDEKPVKYEILDGRTMLEVSRTVYNRIQHLGLMYQITEDMKYAKRGWLEMRAACRFPDWNAGRHFLDTAEMMAGVAIGYDWLYDALTTAQRKEIVNAIVNKGLMATRNAFYKVGNYWWVTGNNNWTAVCNGGSMVAALAVADEVRGTICEEVFDNTLKSIRYILDTYIPEGANQEGVGYWTYQTAYLVNMLASMDSALGTDYGLFNAPGVSDSAHYAMYMVGPKGSFNLNDDGVGYFNSPELLWYANKLGDSSVAEHRINSLNTNTPTPRDLIFYNPDIISEDKELSLNKLYSAAGTAVLRSSWEDNGIFFGLHGGDNNVNHSHLDAGTFVFDMLGERWADDIGKDDYNLPGYNDFAYGRWTYYALKAEGHNTLMINPGRETDQIVKSVSTFERVEGTEKEAVAVVNLKPAYDKKVNKLLRGVKLFNNRQNVLIQDEISCKSAAEIYWFMHTSAKVAIAEDGKSAILEKNGKKIWAGLQADSEAKFTLLAAKPLPSSPNPKGQYSFSGYKKLAVHFEQVKDVTLRITFIPLMDETPSAANLAPVTAINSWMLEEGQKDLPVLENIQVDGKPLDEFNPDLYSYKYKLNITQTQVPKLSAEFDEDRYTVNIVQADRLPGIAKIVVTDKKNPENKILYTIDMKYEISSVDLEGMKQITIKSATASDVPEPQNPPAATIDGNLATRWASQGEQWIMYDLGAVYELSALSIAYNKGSERMYRIKILTSTDGENWEEFFSGESSGKTNDYETFALHGRKARWIRIDTSGNSENLWNGITEFAVFSN